MEFADPRETAKAGADGKSLLKLNAKGEHPPIRGCIWNHGYASNYEIDNNLMKAKRVRDAIAAIEASTNTPKLIRIKYDMNPHRII